MRHPAFASRGLRSGLAVLVACGLAACTQGPNFASPAGPTGTRYTVTGGKNGLPAEPSGAQRLALGVKVRADWWTLFRSPVLDRVVAQALAESPTLAAARATLAEAREETNAFAGGALPQVNAIAGITRQKFNAAETGISEDVPSVNVFSIGPSVSYDVDVFGALKRGVEADKARAEIARYRLAAAYLSLSGNVVRQALTIAAVRAQIKTVNEILADDQKNLDLVKTSQAAGTATLVDVTSAASQLANDRTLLPPLDQELSVARHALAVYAGRMPGEWSPPAFDIARLTLPPDLPVSLPSALVRQRPDILAAEAQIHVDSAEIGVATANLYPDLDITAEIEQQATHLDSFFDGIYNGFNVTAGLTAPLFHGGTLRARRRAAIDAFNASFATYRETVLRSFGQVADVLQALAHDDEQVTDESQALASARQALHLARLSYGAGNTGILQVLDAERLSERAELGVVRAEAQRYLDTAQLFLALGSGWWNTPATLPASVPAAVSPSIVSMRTVNEPPDH